MNSSEKARYIITKNRLLTLATADENGKPRISPVVYTCDEKFNLYWVSNKDALHSQNIRKRPQVDIVMVGNLPDGTTDGVYYDAEAEELNNEAEVSLAMKLMQKRNQDEKFRIKSIKDVTETAVWRIYRASPIKAYKRGDQTLNGQAITVREPIKL